MWSLIGIGLQISFVAGTKSVFLKRIKCWRVPVTSTLGLRAAHCSFIAQKKKNLWILCKYENTHVLGDDIFVCFFVGRLVETYSLWSKIYQPITDCCRVLATLVGIWVEMRAFEFCNIRVQISKFCCSLSIYRSLYKIHPPKFPYFFILRDKCEAVSKGYEVAV